ncbi:MAG: hypothetical protein KDA42_14830 [Planctomycetales bacterium]|nr:hypothetical protein [Planctomycetales bacterium]
MLAFGLCVANVVGLFDTCEAQAVYNGRRSVQGDVFYNYYAQDHRCNQGQPAQLYMSPLPAPPIVGHTYYTYQPLMPHEYMYAHHRDYWRATPGGSWSHTSVEYKTGPRWVPGLWFFRH